ncbi:hypothetical protein Nizo1840_0188 [Lactiplantibacillus plantarum]|nr:hypothetical protein Nizo1840_0188 [Lactiplantibacillus plantarum]
MDQSACQKNRSSHFYPVPLTKNDDTAKSTWQSHHFMGL